LTSPETWNLCLAILVGAGYREVPARAIIGRCLSQYKEEDVIEAFQDAAGKVDPVAYARKILSKKPRKINGRSSSSAAGQNSRPQMLTAGSDFVDESPASIETARKVIEQMWDVLKRR